jgi:hypothetical protein
MYILTRITAIFTFRHTYVHKNKHNMVIQEFVFFAALTPDCTEQVLAEFFVFCKALKYLLNFLLQNIYFIF